MIPEGAIIDWAAVYLRRDLGASVWVSGFGFAACGDDGGDALCRGQHPPALGARPDAAAGAVVGALGLAMAALAPPGWAMGFWSGGLGIPIWVPIAFSAAGNLPGIAPPGSASVAATLGYSRHLVAPGLIDLCAAEHMAFSAIFWGWRC